MIRLYRAPSSTNVLRVTLALAHKGLAGEVESVWIDYADRSAVVAVSGQELVPVLDHDGVVIPDSLAILRHLEEVAPDPPLWPADPARRAKLDLFLDWFDRVWKRPPNAIADRGGRDPGRDAELMDERMDLFESMLTGHDHLLGDFSAADCAAWPFLRYALGREPGDVDLGGFHATLEAHLSLDGRPALAAWVDRMAQRPTC